MILLGSLSVHLHPSQFVVRRRFFVVRHRFFVIRRRLFVGRRRGSH